MSDRVDPKAVVVRYFEDVWNARQLNVIDEVLAPVFVGHERNAADTHGPAGMHQVAEAFFHHFPDAVFTILDAIAEGDMVVLHLRLQATHRTSGHPITVTGMALYRLGAGKITECWSKHPDCWLSIVLDKPHRPRYPDPIPWPYRSISIEEKEGPMCHRSQTDNHRRPYASFPLPEQTAR